MGAGRELDLLSTNACRTVRSQFPLLTFNCCPNGHIKLNKISSSCSLIKTSTNNFLQETGIQQGDPIGPVLFDLSVDGAARGVQYEFNEWYLDDATLGDCLERVHDDLVVLLERLREIGLEVNGSKCEFTIFNYSPGATEALLTGLFPWVKVVEACDFSLLGAPVDIQAKAFRELSMRRVKSLRESRQSCRC